MEVDSGAKVSIIDKGTFHALFPDQKPRMVPTPYVLRDYNGVSVDILGMATVPVKYGDILHSLPV